MKPACYVYASLILLALSGGALSAQCEFADLDPLGAVNDRFGFHMDLAGETLFVSARQDDSAAPDGGAVYVYVRRDDGLPGHPAGDSWVPIGQLTASDAGSGDSFGHAIAVRGDLAVIGAAYKGSAYVFQRDDGGTPGDPFDDVWIEVDQLFPSLPDMYRFGRSVTLWDDTIVVGPRAGRTAYVYERTDSGTPALPFDDQWIETAAIQADDDTPGESFGLGYSVELYEDTLLVGAFRDDVDFHNSGSVYAYERDDGGTPGDPFDDLWVQFDKITADVTIHGAEFGCYIALEGETALIGANQDDSPSPRHGKAYVFERDRAGTPADPSDDQWVQTAVLTAADGHDDALFGFGVDLDGDVAVVGARGQQVGGKTQAGSAYVFERDDRGTPADPFDDLWPATAQFVATDADPHDWFGIHLAVDGRTVVVGAPMTNDSSRVDTPGNAYTFALDCDMETIDFRTEDDRVTLLVDGQDVNSPDEFGRLLSIDGLSASGNRAAIFDSDRSGPNADLFGQDHDLLVDRGNLLILQQNAEQLTPGIYNVANDDAGGGDFVIDFGSPAVAVSLDLVDIDFVMQEAVVTLTDLFGRTRTYLAPSGWTGDVESDGRLGYAKLDLTTLAPQPGFASTAIGSEEPGFDPEHVLRMTVHFEGSAALDNIRFVQAPDPVTRRCFAWAPDRSPAGEPRGGG